MLIQIFNTNITTHTTLSFVIKQPLILIPIRKTKLSEIREQLTSLCHPPWARLLSRSKRTSWLPLGKFKSATTEVCSWAEDEFVFTELPERRMMLHPVGCVSVSREVVIDVCMALDQTLTERNPWRSQTDLVKTRAWVTGSARGGYTNVTPRGICCGESKGSTSDAEGLRGRRG
ncbi:uncharacterized protein L203_102468 [Cryptococcus depauperatus CBS 7841]|uniref:Uncharacterized protein n=1 Tax=Cryptococcus depauperatus CBS 7841 TaxID=1295531 RepID=A0AAJ8JRQ7_9TREE